MYAESQDEKRPVSYPPRWSLPRGRDELCASHNCCRSVLSASVTWSLAPYAAYREACSRKARQRCRCVERVRGPPCCQSCHLRLDLCLACQKIAHPLLNLCAGIRVAQHGRCQSCFSSFDAVNLGAVLSLHHGQCTGPSKVAGAGLPMRPLMAFLNHEMMHLVDALQSSFHRLSGKSSGRVMFEPPEEAFLWIHEDLSDRGCFSHKDDAERLMQLFPLLRTSESAALRRVCDPIYTSHVEIARN